MRMQIIFSICLAAVLSASQTVMAKTYLADNIGYYITRYGDILPRQDDQIATAHRVFERVRAVANKNIKYPYPKLVVVNSPSKPWAIALPDGYIVLSKKAVEICHRDATPELAEARLAFILGHELSHIARDDFRHLNLYAELTASVDSSVSGMQKDYKMIRSIERFADEEGFLYAALAGYPAVALLNPKEDFLSFWAQQTKTIDSLSHGSAKERTRALRDHLEKLADKLPFFNFGVRLAHFDRCHDALYFLRDFQANFAGREVKNNIGYCNLQIAREEMDFERANFYCMPLLLDNVSRFPGVFRGTRSLKSLREAVTGDVQGYLLESIDYLKKAMEADTTYMPTRLNLATAYLYLGKAQNARAVLEDALLLEPDNVELQTLDAIAIYEGSNSTYDGWPEAIHRLERLAANPAEFTPCVLFNLARLLEARPRPRDASEKWDELLDQIDRLPNFSLQTIACSKRRSENNKCKRTQSLATKPLPWQRPLPKSNIPNFIQQSMSSTPANWKKISFDWHRPKMFGSIYLSSDNHKELLMIDGSIQMQVFEFEQPTTVANLQDYCALPLLQRKVAAGIIYTCEKSSWAALTDNRLVQQIWWNEPF